MSMTGLMRLLCSTAVSKNFLGPGSAQVVQPFSNPWTNPPQSAAVPSATPAASLNVKSPPSVTTGTARNKTQIKNTFISDIVQF